MAPKHASTRLNPVEAGEVVKYHSIGAGKLPVTGARRDRHCRGDETRRRRGAHRWNVPQGHVVQRMVRVSNFLLFNLFFFQAI